MIEVVPSIQREILMSEQDGTQATPAPAIHDHESWKTYWALQGQPWRTEPEIAAERQDYLAGRHDA